MAQTTSVELKGDRVVAKQLADSQVRRLLEIFRRNNSFQDLKTNSHRAFFIDSSGRQIGEIHMQTNHGIETVVVVGLPSGGQPAVRPEPKFPRTEVVSYTVPCIRSLDNRYWVVCLSGTFEPPYYLVENTDATLAARMDDLVEAELDGELLLISYRPVGQLEIPQFWFVAQTGSRDSARDEMAAGTFQNIYLDTDGVYGVTDDPDYTSIKAWIAAITDLPGHWEFCDAVLDYYGVAWVAIFDADIDSSDDYTRQVTFNGTPIHNTFNLHYRFDRTFSGEIGTGQTTAGPGGAPLDYPSSETGDLNPIEVTSVYGTGAERYVYDVAYPKAISIAEDTRTDFAACCGFTAIDETKLFDHPGDCFGLATQTGDFPWASLWTFSRQYRFLVNEATYTFFSPPSFADALTYAGYMYVQEEHTGPDGGEHYDCVVLPNGLKYYRTPDPDDVDRGLLCAIERTFTVDEEGDKDNIQFLNFHYAYIGPNQPEGMHVTFPAVENTRTHLIPEMQDSTGSDIVFGGEVFLARITGEIEANN